MASHSLNGTLVKDSQESYSSNIDVTSRMQVPKRISVLGVEEEEILPSYGNRYSDFSDAKYEMKVPERILVVGQDGHIGVKAPPHELVLENAIIPMETVFPPVRVMTPPRSITVDSLPSNHDQLETSDEALEDNIKHDTNEIMIVSERNEITISEPPQLTLTSTQLTEEVLVLRQQMGRIHRRMTALERDQNQRQQRDALMISIGAVYLVWKVLLWLTRST